MIARACSSVVKALTKASSTSNIGSVRSRDMEPLFFNPPPALRNNLEKLNRHRDFHFRNFRVSHKSPDRVGYRPAILFFLKVMAKPGIRRVAREVAIQYLFSHDLNKMPEAADSATGSDDGESDPFWELRPTRKKERAFAEGLLNGLAQEKQRIDSTLAAAIDNYSFHRLAAVDRNILRLAAYEILFRDDIPVAVSINEAVEIAKRFGTVDSAKFVNGVLDRISKDAKSD